MMLDVVEVLNKNLISAYEHFFINLISLRYCYLNNDNFFEQF
jgi:hypothetical protein